jgi:hypothetical protein
MKYFFFAICIVFFSCNNFNKKNSEQELFDYGGFYMKIPNNCKQESLHSIDSYAGKITCDSSVIYFDYGNLAISLSKPKTEREYIESQRWLPDALVHLVPLNHEFSSDTINKTIHVVNIDVNTRKAKVSYNGKLYLHSIEIPKYLQGIVDKVDTLKGVVRRLIYNEGKYQTNKNYEFQIINTNVFNSTMNTFDMLVLKAESIRPIDTSFMLDIFYSAKLKTEK